MSTNKGADKTLSTPSMGPFVSLNAYLESLPEWQDDLKARSMFASFSQPRDVNPEAWDARFEFWRKVLLESVEMGLLGQSVFSIDQAEDLAFLFCRNHITPLGLADVLLGMRQKGLLTASLEAASSLPLSERLFWGPLRNTWGWVLGYSSSTTEQHNGGQHRILFCPSLLQKWTNLVCKAVDERGRHNSFSAFFTIESLGQLISELRGKEQLKSDCSIDDVKLLINFMKSKGRLELFEDTDTELILRVRLTSEKGPIKISEEHRNIMKLQKASQKLSQYISSIDEKIAAIKSNVLQSLKLKDKPSALQHLKRSKEYEKIKLQRLSCLSTIEAILLKIENSQSERQVFEAYQIGERTLKSILSTMPDVSIIDELMGSIKEAVDESDQISHAMGMTVDVLEDDEDLLAELASLSLPVSPVEAKPVLELDREIVGLQDNMEHLELGSAPSPVNTATLIPN